MTTMKTMTTTMKKIMLILTATKVDDDKAEEALYSMRTLMTMHDYNDNEGDDLYIILMRLFVCLSVMFRHHTDC